MKTEKLNIELETCHNKREDCYNCCTELITPEDPCPIPNNVHCTDEHCTCEQENFSKDGKEIIYSIIEKSINDLDNCGWKGTDGYEPMKKNLLKGCDRLGGYINWKKVLINK